ncbi:hypothetical protein ACFLRO_00465 [Bacteroidota bacterium]
MHQKSVFSPSIIGKVYSNLRGTNLSALRQLETEILLVDGSGALLAEIADALGEASGDQLAQSVIEAMVSGRPRLQIVDQVTAVPRPQSELSRLATEEEVGHMGGADFLVGKADGRRTASGLGQKDLLPHTISQYISPSVESRVRPLYVRHELMPGDKFDFERWFGAYLKDTKALKVVDGYINRSPARENFEILLRLVPKGIKVRVDTLSDDARNGRGVPDGDVVADIVKTLGTTHGVDVQVREFENKTELGNRWLSTDRFTIDLGKGLGFCRGGKAIREQVITVTYRG